MTAPGDESSKGQRKLAFALGTRCDQQQECGPGSHAAQGDGLLLPDREVLDRTRTGAARVGLQNWAAPAYLQGWGHAQHWTGRIKRLIFIYSTIQERGSMS